MEKISSNMEDYLKTIYKLYCESDTGVVFSSDVAARMGFRKASVSHATARLAEKGLLVKGKGLRLTDSGLQYARYIGQRYSAIMRFFHEVLGVDLETAQRDACGVEHVISADSYRSICSRLKEQAIG